MAFLKFARAQVIHPNVSNSQWGRVKTASGKKALASNLVDQASEIFKKKFDPTKYLLTHCTIVASVDSYDVPNIKLGSVMQGGRKVNRLYKNFRVTPETDQFINNNLDSFDREVLKKSYRTFIGAQNFCEHIQLEEQSKGRIIDAALRDIGPSLYVDILVATDRSHKDLIQDIESGKLNTLSMGCSTQSTRCTYCGNVAVDEPQLCDHIKYQKGNVFFDEQGRKHRIAEICGHETLDNGGVNFIEASWVGVPAFKGAVMRNILTPKEMDTETLSKVAGILSSVPKEWAEDKNTLRKAASALYKIAEDEPPADEPPADEPPADEPPADDSGGDDMFSGTDSDDSGGGDSGGDESKGDAESKPDPTPDSIQQLEDQILKKVLKRVQDRVNKTLDAQQQEEAMPNSTDSSLNLNNNIIKQANIRKEYWSGLSILKKTAASRKDFVIRLAKFNPLFGVHIPGEMYKLAWAMGNTSQYKNPVEFIKKANKLLNRKLTLREAKLLIRLSKLL